MKTFLGGWRAAALALVIIGAVAPAASAAGPSIHVLSNRADVISGGDALVSIDLPAGTSPSAVTVTAAGRDVSDSFALRPNGEFEGLVTGLAPGANALTATLPDGSSDSITIVDHAIGGAGVARPPQPPPARPARRPGAP